MAILLFSSATVPTLPAIVASFFNVLASFHSSASEVSWLTDMDFVEVFFI
jgi:hypothetical protein